jgi:DNA-binding LacI/PurR family transcriptional regulator
MLLNMLADPHLEIRRVALPTELVVRQSCRSRGG